MPTAKSKAPLVEGVDYTMGSDNVFADLGLPDADELLRKADLMIAVVAAIRAAGMTQARVAATLGVDQPKVSRLLHGHLREFSVDRLLRFLTLLKYDVTITVRPAAAAAGVGRVVVASAKRRPRRRPTQEAA